GKILREGQTPLIDGPVFGDNLSFTQLVEANYDALEVYLEEYRKIMKQNAAGEIVTMPAEG
ncbi:MAG: hypothetical protein K2N36_03030, partial [Ruminiclostridium sp.]|nr:hypothetical protein [Ruminiclostridium sp.]